MDNQDDSKREPPSKRYSHGLVNQAIKGKFATGRPSLSIPATNIASESTEGTVKLPGNNLEKNNLEKNNREKNEVGVSYKQAKVTSPAVVVENVTLDSLPSDRIDLNNTTFMTDSDKKRELFITAAASKSLTRLFCALTLEPGSGKEVPVAIKTKVLDNLIRESHLLADNICTSIMEPGKKPPIYLRAKVLQQCAEFVSDQWIKSGIIDTSALKKMTYLAFSGSVDSLSQEIVDLFHLAGEYTPATSQEISKTRITESSVRASWLLLRCVNEFDLNTYDPDVSADSDPRPFSYGRDPFSVASDLTKIALEMTRANRLDINNLDIATTWTQNSIDRACSMVRSEYTLITDRSLRSCFRDELFSEASLGRIDSLYPKILERINASARHAYILVEKNALDAMSATAYAHYLPKKEAQGQNENKKNQQPSASQPPTRVIPPITSGFSAFMSNRSSRNDGLKTTETLLPDASLTPAAIDAPETLDETLDQQREPNHPASPVFSPSKFTIQRQKNAS